MAIALTPTSNPLSNRLLLSRLPRVCLAVHAPTVGEMLAKAERAWRDNCFIELRLDYVKQPLPAIPRIREFTMLHPTVVLMATCRKTIYGGRFRGTIDAELNILAKAAEAGCQLVDVSVQSAERLSASAVEELRTQANLVLSYHDFEGTRKIDEVFERMRRIPADVYKLVFTANSFGDNLKVVRFLEQNSGQTPLVGLCMGEQGIASRILSIRAGSTYTYGSYAPGEETAPGQVDIRTLRNVYRIENVNRATRVYGVLGHPLTHSLSPLMLNAAFRRESVNAVYLPFPARKHQEVLEAAHQIPLSGFSVTQPHKSAFLDSLDGIDPLARKIGAINTVVRTNNKLYGFNTDIGGIVTPLQLLLPLQGSRILVLGAGGAARAAVFGLRNEGARVFICNRTPARARTLAKQSGAQIVRRADLRKLQFDAIINATPVGQLPNTKQSPLEPDEIKARVVFDLVYNPIETELLRLARAAGAKVIPGVEMFIRQGARQFEIWTGKPAPIEEMRREVVGYLQAHAKSAG